MFNNIQGIDEAILFYIQNNLRNPVIDQVMLFFTALGNSGLIWYAIAVILLFNKRYQRCGITLIISVSLAMLIGDELLKPLFERVRPCNKFPDIAMLLARPKSYSFPSGHAMISFAAACVLNYYKPLFGILAYILASIIAFSRLYLFVHYPSDVLGGMLFGTICSMLIIYGLNNIFRNIEHRHMPSH